MPTTIAAPKRAYCKALRKAHTFNIWLSSVTKNAASQVEVGLAGPAERAAPPSTTAATGKGDRSRRGRRRDYDEDAGDEDGRQTGGRRRRGCTPR